ncbi:MAG: Nif3-like dinuclear metal center hexameric protein, partial [Phycisphaerales bacterium]|nr:Nif3-like dinuclear metal center hexameric protein [Phycisphaerales bacterium]
MTTTVRDIVTTLDRLAPFELAESWDNVGLLLGCERDALDGPVLLTIDLTRAVFEEAREMNASCVLAYHPPIFHEIKRITGASPRGGLILDVLRAGISVVSPHTALDAAPDGMADWLMDGVGAGRGDRRALSPHRSEVAGGAKKIVTFVPTARTPAVRDAMVGAGAGVIGGYDTCSYVVSGRGTFRGGEGTNPVVGERGRLEVVEEDRLEMVCPEARLAEVLAALRLAHPYEEPAFDVYGLAAAPDWSRGGGRCETLEGPAGVDEVAARLRLHLGVDVIKVAAAPGAGVVRRVGVCPGAGGSLLDAALAAWCDGFVTSEMQHHQALAALERGCSVFLAGHTSTERGYLPTLALRLTQALPDLD